MCTDSKIVNKFYRDYKMLNRLISDKSNISSVEISKFINYKIVKSFSEHEKYKSLLDLLKYEKPNKMNDFSEFEENIEKVIGKYNWSINKFDENRLTPDIIGKVFEKYINQRENGAYYTDDDTINYIIDNTLIPNIVSRLSNNNRMSHIFNELKICDIINSPNKMIDEFKLAITKIDKSDMQEIILILNKTTIADISVGTGAFLVNSIDYLLELYKSIYENLNEDLPIKSIIKNITNNTIYGLDLMEDAINIARFRVYLKAVQIFKEFDIDTEVISKLNLHCVNSLLKNVKNLIPEVIENGGFDIIVGNPPYIEYSKIKNYTINGYKTLKAGNVYAYMIERSLELLKKEGNLGVIVPISIVSTQRMKTLRQLVMDECKDIWLANFADRPGSLFNGVHQKLSIVIARKEKVDDSNVYTTNYVHWYERDRKNLFKELKYIRNHDTKCDFIPKYGNSIEKKIINKIFRGNDSLEYLVSPNGNQELYISMRMTFWVKAFLKEKTSKEYKQFYFENEIDKSLYYLLVNSDIFYFYWEVVADGWHITNKELSNFKFDINKVHLLDYTKLQELAVKLEEDIEHNKEFIGSKQVDYVYKHKKSKIIIDEINKFVAPIFSLTDNEIEYIKMYNISYRLNDEYNNYLSYKRRDN